MRKGERKKQMKTEREKREVEREGGRGRDRLRVIPMDK
jgi:hypothetical protein